MAAITLAALPSPMSILAPSSSTLGLAGQNASTSPVSMPLLNSGRPGVKPLPSLSRNPLTQSNRYPNIDTEPTLKEHPSPFPYSVGNHTTTTTSSPLSNYCSNFIPRPLYLSQHASIVSHCASTLNPSICDSKSSVRPTHVQQVPNMSYPHLAQPATFSYSGHKDTDSSTFPSTVSSPIPDAPFGHALLSKFGSVQNNINSPPTFFSKYSLTEKGSQTVSTAPPIPFPPPVDLKSTTRSESEKSLASSQQSSAADSMVAIGNSFAGSLLLAASAIGIYLYHMHRGSFSWRSEML